MVFQIGAEQTCNTGCCDRRDLPLVEKWDNTCGMLSCTAFPSGAELVAMVLAPLTFVSFHFLPPVNHLRSLWA